MGVSNYRLGEEGYNRFGTKMKIVEYINTNNITVEFQDEHKYRIKTAYKCFKNNAVTNLYDKSVFSIGYIGEGKCRTKMNNIKTKEYVIWNGMMERCYSKKAQLEDRNKSYIGCSVSVEWHNFQNFAKWYDENYYEVEGEAMCLDKDILIKGNRVYSPKTCAFVPEIINKLFINSKGSRGNLPVGITYNKLSNKYVARVTKYNKRICLGYYANLNESFLAYKNEKENHIKHIADEYKDKIPRSIYDAMYEYKVEITD